MPVVLRLWAPPGEDSASAEFGHMEKTVAGIAAGRKPVLLEYVQSCDVDAYRGHGDAKFTSDVAKAKRFPDVEAAAYWKRQSRDRPFRPDGQPNRPLTAYNVTFEDVP